MKMSCDRALHQGNSVLVTVSPAWRDTCLHLSFPLAPTDPAAPSTARELSVTSQLKKLQETIEQKTKIEIGDVIRVRGYVHMFREEREIRASMYCKHGEFLPDGLLFKGGGGGWGSGGVLCKRLFSSRLAEVHIRFHSNGEIMSSVLFLGKQHFKIVF